MTAQRPLPEWYAEPQLGVFIHWGIFTIPAYAPRGRAIHELTVSDYDRACVLSPYSEWYDNAARVAGSPTAERHARLYGDRPYASFREDFDRAAAAFDADAWADLFAEAGARYVVFVAKHHDGYCLWPTDIPNPWRPGWNTTRDFVGELAQAVRARGMRFGLYYSGGLDWTARPEPPIANLGDMFAAVPVEDDYCAYAAAQVRELIARYRPSVLWNDIAWPREADLDALFADYYAAVPEGVTNDRWFAASPFFASLRDPATRKGFNDMMKARMAAGESMGSGPARGDFRCVEYGLGEIPATQKWEACRGVGLAFGYNAEELPEDFLDADGLKALYRDVTSKRGNLLINVGPRADGSIPAEQAAPLRALGALTRAAG